MWKQKIYSKTCEHLIFQALSCNNQQEFLKMCAFMEKKMQNDNAGLNFYWKHVQIVLLTVTC